MLTLLPGAESLPTILTTRLLLRALTPSDIPSLFAVFGDPEVCRYWSRPALTSIGDATALLEEIDRFFAERSLFQWGIAQRESNTVVGTCTLSSLTPAHRRAEVGFALARSVWRRGYMAEALPSLVRFGFETLGLHRLEADVDPRNASSIRVLERAGFAREGRQRERYLLNGEAQDALLYGLLEREWRRRS